MRKVSIYLKLTLAFIVFLILTYYVKNLKDPSIENTVLQGFLMISSFLFGIIIAFSIANRYSRLNSIKEALRDQDAVLLNIYFLSRRLGKLVSEKVRKMIDDLLISQIDYNLVDFDKESPRKIKEIYFYFEELKEKHGLSEEVISKILDSLLEILKINQKVSREARSKMAPYEWFSSGILGAIMIICLFYVNTGSVFSMLIISFISTSLILLLILLKDLNSLEWQEQNWIWDPLSKMFIELDLLPYFTADVLQEGRINIKEFNFHKIRVAYHSKPYPNMTGKIIKIEDLRNK